MKKPSAERVVPRASRAVPRRSASGPSRMSSRGPSRGSSRMPFPLLIGGLIAAGMVTLLGLNTAAAANEVQRTALVEQDQNVGARLVGLRNEVAASAAPANLARAAAALGMVPAGQPGFLQVGRDGRVRLLGRAYRATGVPVVAPSETAPPRPTATATSTRTPTASSTASSTTSSTASPETAHPAGVTATATVTVTATPSVSTGQTASRHHRRAHRARAAGAAAPTLNPATATTPSPSPSPSPTPQLTLPGGTR